jgi:uncharacterized protein
MRYFDASALVKRYVRETGSLTVRRLLSTDSSATSRVSVVEITSALTRRAREGAFTDVERDRALTALERDIPFLLIVELAPDVVKRAQTLLQRWPLRSGDAIQLATCMYLQAELDEAMTFVAFDRRLTDVARREGVPIA